ncbi:MAG: PA14 domain-containing protein, partial [Kiritimatiellia bacterium]
PQGFVVPELITMPDFIARERLDDFAAVILADVPRMPSNTAARLLQFVERGGGLLAFHGPRSDSVFYNGWQTQEQHPVMPLALDEAGLTPAVREPVMVDTLSIIHPALQPLAPDSDIATTGFIRHWPATAASARTRIGARLFNGQPLLADHTVGKGRILQWTAPVDPAAGNLVSRQSFLPLMHELVYYLASPVVPDLNLPPMRGATLSLGSGQSEAGETSENGLRALYYRGTEQREALLARTDPQINFNWGQKGPAPGLPAGSFNTVWTGSLKVPVSGRYRLFTRAEGDMTVQIDAGLDSRARAASSLRIDLDATRRHDLVVRYTSVKNRASANLLWEGPGIGARHVPATALSPVRVRSDGWSETHETRVYPPRGEPLEALLQQSQDTLALHIPHRLTPGLYRAEVPAVWVPLFRDLAVVSNGMAQITFCVATDGNESRLATVTPDEAAFTRRYADLVLAATADEMHRALGGGATGRELWRPLAVALFFLLLAETILTRWIAIQRKTGAEALPVFDEPAGPSAASFRATMGTLNRSQP